MTDSLWAAEAWVAQGATDPVLAQGLADGSIRVRQDASLDGRPLLLAHLNAMTPFRALKTPAWPAVASALVELGHTPWPDPDPRWLDALLGQDEAAALLEAVLRLPGAPTLDEVMARPHRGSTMGWSYVPYVQGRGPWTPLEAALLQDHRALVATFLSLGVDPDRPGANGFRPLDLARSPETAVALVTAGAQRHGSGPGQPWAHEKAWGTAITVHALRERMTKALAPLWRQRSSDPGREALEVVREPVGWGVKACTQALSEVGLGWLDPVVFDGHTTTPAELAALALMAHPSVATSAERSSYDGLRRHLLKVAQPLGLWWAKGLEQADLARETPTGAFGLEDAMGLIDRLNTVPPAWVHDAPLDNTPGLVACGRTLIALRWAQRWARVEGLEAGAAHALDAGWTAQQTLDDSTGTVGFTAQRLLYLSTALDPADRADRERTQTTFMGLAERGEPTATLALGLLPLLAAFGPSAGPAYGPRADRFFQHVLPMAFEDPQAARVRWAWVAQTVAADSSRWDGRADFLAQVQVFLAHDELTQRTPTPGARAPRQRL